MQRPDGSEVWFWAAPDHEVFLADGKELATLVEVWKPFMEARWPKLMEDIGLRDIEEDREQELHLEIAPLAIPLRDGEVLPLYVRYEEGVEPELHLVVRAVFTGRGIIHVSEIPLTHARLGEVEFAFGETTLGGKPALLVVTEDETGGKLSFRFSEPRKGIKSRAATRCSRAERR